jgi:hypothetical protein
MENPPKVDVSIPAEPDWQTVSCDHFQRAALATAPAALRPGHVPYRKLLYKTQEFLGAAIVASGRIEARECGQKSCFAAG